MNAGVPGTVDVVVVTYESGHHLAACLEPLAAEGVRVIVVDNDSSDGSVDVARAAGAEVIANSDNRGFAAAANQGARAGHGDVIVFLNPDAITSAQTIAYLAWRVLADATVGVAGARLSHPDGRPQRSQWPYPGPRDQWRAVIGRAPAEPDGFVVGALLAVRRDVFEQLGGFDESFWLYGEEADLCRRAADRGLKVVLVDGAHAVHVGGASSAPGSPRTFAHFARGSDLFVLRHHGRGGLLSYRLATVLKHGLRALVRSRERRVHGRIVRRAVRQLVTHPLAVPPEPPIDRRSVPRRSVGGSCDVVVASLEPWDDVWRRNQFLVRELLAADPGLRVLWIEPPVDLLHSVLTGRGLPRIDRSLRPVPGTPRVVRFRPVKWLPRVVWPWVDASLRRQVERAVRRTGLTRPVLWLNDTALHGLTANRWPTVYDITDDWLSSGATGRELRRLAAREAEALAAADEVVVCSPELARRRGATRRVELIPNAVDAAAFRSPRSRPPDLPPAPTAVYLGTLHDDRLDVDLVASLAAARPELNVVLVGPDSLSERSRTVLRNLGNVHVLGARPYAEVPGYLQHADVVIVPHAVNEFTESLDPIKAYEIAALGRPTVATPVAGFRGMSEPVVVADREAFVSAVDDALAGPGTSHPLPVPSWTERAQAFRSVLDRAADAHRKRLRVAYVGHCALRSGGELALARLLPAITGEVEATVILAEDGPMVEVFGRAGAKVEVLPLAGTARQVRKGSVRPGALPLAAVAATVGYTWRLARRLRRLDVDLVHTNTLKAAIYGGLAARLAGKPLVWHVRDRIAADYLPGFAVKAVRTAARLLPHAIITNSESTRETLGIAGLDAMVTPSPVVFDPYAPDPAQLTLGSVFEVGMVGRIAPWKGQDVFLRAFAAAFPEGEVRARIIGAPLFGETDYEADLRRLAADLGIADRVWFTGQTDDVASHLAQLSVLVHASITPEPFGQVVVEGLAAGLAVVASAAGGPAEIITDGVDGLLIPPGDVAALASALRRLHDDPGLRERLGVAGARRAEAFRPERIGPQVLSLYRSLLQERGRS